MKSKANIERAIANASTLSKLQLPTHFNTILQQINQLDKQITLATSFIPTYDERQYALQIKELLRQFEETKAKLTPKSKFSFKSRQNLTKTAPASPSKPLPRATPITNIPKGETIEWKELSNQVLTLPAEPAQVAVSLSHLDHCVVWLKSDMVQVSAVHMKQVHNCVIVTGSVQGSILMYGVENCTMVLACHQFRMHDAHDVDLLLQVSSHPIMEDSNGIGLAENPAVQATHNDYDKMEDFNWLKQQASPNWHFLEANRKIFVHDSSTRLIGFSSLESMLPKRK
ncbi:TBCC-domain-containing protein [Hesseltinella vesiculosa]|uniref:TBCC-domain-containing protein n=1 Tax=Hesseltinella vesiculosa TaxID=101127 RepID=A0A1X2GBC5_9FUNG|nr:TBCC-domain-containing protein [Hesseltinella vesiculosa]